MAQAKARTNGDRRYRSAIAVERAVDLLFVISDRGETTLGELARSIGSTRSAAHRILTALKNKGIVDQEVENGPYSLSWSILALTRSLSAKADMRTVSLPFMRELSVLSSETITLSVRSHSQRVCIEQVEGPHEVRWTSEIGRSNPLYAGATGRVILAFTPSDEVDAYLDGISLEKITDYTITDRKRLLEDLDWIRDRGYAFANQDRVIGVSGVSAPILNSNGRALAAMTIAGPSERLTQVRLEELVPDLVQATSEIGAVLAAGTGGTTE
jgi:DNA-binding IclR family transcriptional regulator